MANLVHNERVKLFATLLNTVAAGSATVGILAPFSAIIFSGVDVIVSQRGAVYVMFCAILHGFARLVLKGLRE